MRNLIVPMMAEAFLKNNYMGTDSRIPLSAPDYQAAVTNSYLGSNNTPRPFNMDREPLQCGVHLHFILPDAFTHADEQNQYPAVPDRFLVTRLAVTKEEELSIRRFIVESNFLSDSREYCGNVTIPMFSDGPSGSMFRYLGRAYPEGEKPKKQGDYLTGLTAVGPGDPAFAAYYPSCHSVFGFYDAMENVPVDTKLSYFVTGYFSETDSDPMSSVTDEKSFLEILGQQGFSVKDSKKLCNRTLFFAEATGIVWKGPDYDYGKEIPQGEIEVYVGNTSAEALSAAIKRKMPEAHIEERYMTALQYALLDSAEEIDGNFIVDDGIHAQRFEAVQNEAGGITVASEKGGAAIGKSYTALIKKMEASARKSDELTWEREKLFCLWEQYMYLYEADDTEKTPSKEECRAELKRTIERIRAEEKESERLKQETCAMKEQFEAGLPKGTSMKTSGGEPYYSPKDPSLLLSGSGLKRSFAFGEDGRYRKDQTVLCQTEPLTCNVDAETLFSCFGSSAFCSLELPVSDCYRELLVQAVLLSPEIKERLEKDLGSLTAEGEYSFLAVCDTPQSFTTLFMDWSARFYPTRTSGAGESDNTLDGWEFTYGETDYTTDAARSEEKNIVYTGRTVITPHAVYNLKASLSKWLEDHSEDEEAKKAIENLETVPVLSQNMDGFTAQLCGLKQAFQFPVIGNEGDEALALAVEEAVGSSKVSCMPSSELYSMRGGYFRIERLNLLGTFGQVQRVIVPSSSAGSMQKIYYSENICARDEDYGLLGPSFTVPARLSFQWVSRKDNGCLSALDETAAPVCGFLLPEILNRRLLAYTEDGAYIGTMKTVYRTGKEEARWVSGPGFPRKLEEMEVNRTLRAFLLSMSEGDAFSGLLRLIDLNFDKTLLTCGKNIAWGRPLALARASVGLQVKGGFDYTKGFQEFGKYNTQGVENIKIPLHMGDACRVSDGMTAVFPDIPDEKGETAPDFGKIYPAWGTPAFENSRILFEDCPKLSFSDGECFLTVLMEAGSEVYLQTGILPVKKSTIPPEYVKKAEKLMLAAELTSVLTTKKVAELPVFQPGKPENFQWCYLDKEGNQIVENAVIPMSDFSRRYLCDGMLLSKEALDE